MKDTRVKLFWNNEVSGKLLFYVFWVAIVYVFQSYSICGQMVVSQLWHFQQCCYSMVIVKTSIQPIGFPGMNWIIRPSPIGEGGTIHKLLHRELTGRPKLIIDEKEGKHSKAGWFQMWESLEFPQSVCHFTWLPSTMM